MIIALRLCHIKWQLQRKGVRVVTIGYRYPPRKAPIGAALSGLGESAAFAGGPSRARQHNLPTWRFHEPAFSQWFTLRGAYSH